MAAASDKSTMRAPLAMSPDTSVARVRDMGMACAACVLVAVGATALLALATSNRQNAALCMSALTLIVMMVVPLLMSRVAGPHALAATSIALVTTLSAMNILPAYLRQSEQGAIFAAVALAAGVFLVLRYLRIDGSRSVASNKLAQTPLPSTHVSVAIPALLAFLAGMSSGVLAHFQFYVVCGLNSAQPVWQIALAIAAAFALASVGKRLRGNALLITLYSARALSIIALVVIDTPTVAQSSASAFLLFDCLTIPALMNQGNSKRFAWRASCPGAAHHIGMVSGAAIATTPYFFGNGFIFLYALTAAATLLCAVSLATAKHARSARLNHAH